MMAMTAVASVLLIFLVLMDAFETMLLPRRVKRPYRFARAFYVYSWTPWAAAARMFRPEKRRERSSACSGRSRSSSCSGSGRSG